VARRRVESKIVAVKSMSGGGPWIHGWGVYGVVPCGMVLRLLCMMMIIDTLRCDGVAYLPGMMNFCASSRRIFVSVVVLLLAMLSVAWQRVSHWQRSTIRTI
jgi:hypothetical protein